MYEEVTVKQIKPKKEWKLFSVTGIAVLVMLFVLALFIGGYLYYGSFRTFVGEFSQTTSVNYRKGGVTVTTEEETFNLSHENIYFVYNAIVNAGRGRIAEVPLRQPDAVLEYKFGGRLELWEVELDERTSNRSLGLFVHYLGSNGYEYAYDTDRMTLDRLPLTARQNKE